MKKTLLIVAVMAVLFSAGSAWANTDWHGRFFNDFYGEWKGTLIDKQAPIMFKGSWQGVDFNIEGTMVATLEYAGNGIYKIVEGILYDRDGEKIGKWNGYFDLYCKPGDAQGAWVFDFAHSIGFWEGRRVPYCN